MPELRFEWDEKKNARNQRKHGVSFHEATSVFSDERALFMEDPDHSETEDRYLLLGMSASLRALAVSHRYRAKGDVVPIISARRATPRERAEYLRRWTA